MTLRLTINPATDTDLTAAAERCLIDGAATPEQLVACLREQFPRVLVVNGVVDGVERRWYVYREGHWVLSRVGEMSAFAQR